MEDCKTIGTNHRNRPLEEASVRQFGFSARAKSKVTRGKGRIFLKEMAKSAGTTRKRFAQKLKACPMLGVSII
jgi:hypothetical protein